MIPVPGYSVSTPYGKRGSYWSCNRDSNGNGIHTGADLAAPAGSKVVAARGGTVEYVNFGSAFGYHQMVVKPGDGTRDFYAHMPSRAVANGARVDAGATVGKVGSEGNVTGPHLHFERHKVSSGGWSCGVVTDPAPSLNYQPSGGGGSSAKPDPKPPEEVEEVPKFSRTRLTKPVTIKAKTWTTITWDTVSSGTAGTKGQAAVMVGPSAFSAAFQALITGTGQCHTRMVERQKNSKGEWEDSDTYPGVQHTLDADGKTYVGDSRVQNVPNKDHRLVAQVWLSAGGVVEHAELSVLYF